LHPPRALECYVADRIKEDEIPGEVEACPLSVEARHLLMAHCPVVVLPELEQDGLTFTNWPLSNAGAEINRQYTLQQPTPRHQRSFELVAPALAKPWYDEYGNMFSAFNLKGNNFSRPGVHEHATALNGYIAWGLQESNVYTRVLRASRLLRERGVSTEYILGLSEPKAYPWPKYGQGIDGQDFVTLQEYKERITTAYWEQLPEDQQTEDSLTELQAKFADMTFLISLRAADNIYRFNDIDELGVYEQVFDFINQHLLTADQAPLDPDSVEDLDRYLATIFIPNLAKNLARLHKDLAHGFANSLNITALGGIVDLDSVHGEPLGLGDKPVTDNERAADFINVTDFIHVTCQPLGLHNFYDNHLQLFTEAYLDEYRAVRGNKDAMISFFEMINATRSLQNENPRFAHRMNIVTSVCESALIRDAAEMTNVQLPHELIDVIRDIPNDPVAMEQLRDALAQHMAALGSALLTDSLKQLTNLDYDIAGNFLDKLDNPAEHDFQNARMSIRQVLRPLIHELYLSRLRSDAAPGSEATVDIIGQAITSVLHKQLALYDYCADVVTAEVMPTLAEELRAACQVRKPTPLNRFRKYYIDVFNKSNLTVTSGDTDITVIAHELKAQRDSLTVSAIEFSNSSDVRHTVADIRDYYIAEIVSDGKLGGGQQLPTKDRPSIDIRLDTDFSYILFIDESADGQRSYRLYVDDPDTFDLDQIIASIPKQEPEKAEQEPALVLF